MTPDTEVLFYHLEARPLERVLPALVEKTLERGWRAVIETPSQARAQAIDALLWTFRDDAFLPHGIAGGEADADQPVLIALDRTNANGAKVRFFVDRAVPRADEAYARIVYLFSGHDPDAIADARAAWKALSAEGHALTYWQQEESGRWVKKE